MDEHAVSQEAALMITNSLTVVFGWMWLLPLKQFKRASWIFQNMGVQ
jgi:hypothetical protein